MDFDNKAEKVLIDKGSHFYCYGHLRGVPVETRSRNPDYCESCLSVIENERKKDKDTDTWQGEVFVQHNKCYTVHCELQIQKTDN